MAYTDRAGPQPAEPVLISQQHPRSSLRAWAIRLTLTCSLAACLGGVGGLLTPRPATPAAAEAAPVGRHGRGRVAPRNAAEVRARSARLHGRKLKRLYAMATPPASWDSVAKGWVPPVVDQGQCGSCWDFSGTGMVDCAYLVAGWEGAPDHWLLSEQYTLDCGRNGGCNGDDNTTVLGWAQQTGLPLSTDYGPYQGRAGRCHLKAGTTMYKVAAWGYCDPSGRGGVTSAGQIKAAIMMYGCCGCAVAAGRGWDSYAGGVYHGSGNRQIDHDVMLVGWDDGKSTAPGKTTWKMRNSWSQDWGDGGYMWIDEGADEIGTEAVWCEAPPSPTPPSPSPSPDPTPIPGSFWSGTITYQDGMIQSITPGAQSPRPAKK